MKSRSILAASLLTILALSACTNNDGAKTVLENNGYTDVKMTGYNIWACSKGDSYHSGFTAKSPAGKQVSGTVCAGLFFKGSTIRFD